jgi:hypothetical protein
MIFNVFLCQKLAKHLKLVSSVSRKFSSETDKEIHLVTFRLMLSVAIFHQNLT